MSPPVRIGGARRGDILRHVTPPFTPKRPDDQECRGQAPGTDRIFPPYDGYAVKTDRENPVVLLARAS